MSILHITSSANPSPSTSTLLGTEAAIKIGTPIVTRDTNAGLPLVDASWIAANFTPEEERTDAQRAVLATSDALIEEVKAADTLIISAPIYNFSVPASLKAWIDLICRAGVTFRYTPDGPQGLLQDKHAILVITSGGTSVGSDIDFASGYLRQIMNFVGITNIEVIAADRIMAEGDQAIAEARSAIAAL